MYKDEVSLILFWKTVLKLSITVQNKFSGLKIIFNSKPNDFWQVLHLMLLVLLLLLLLS